MEHKIILRLTSSLSFAGKVLAVKLEEKEGILLQPSENSEVKIWCPKSEIQMIIMPDGREETMEAMKNEFGFK